MIKCLVKLNAPEYYEAKVLAKKRDSYIVEFKETGMKMEVLSEHVFLNAANVETYSLSFSL